MTILHMHNLYGYVKIRNPTKISLFFLPRIVEKVFLEIKRVATIEDKMTVTMTKQMIACAT